jgi:HPt (histidine-containing phosphotransfer) domain-containing protein
MAFDDHARDPSPPQVEALRRELHSIGGASAVIGATGLSEAAQAVSRLLLSAAPADEVSAALHALTDQLARFAAEVRIATLDPAPASS